MFTLDTLNFDNRYANLGDVYSSPVNPTPFRKTGKLLNGNRDVLNLLDLAHDTFENKNFIDYLTGVKKWPGSSPVAMRYAGHQFGHYVPQLGDGRAILLGQIRNSKGTSYDLHLKGAGQTPYSRDGDGRAVLRSSIREYLCGEAMSGLGIPTTRSLCLIGSDEEVYREQIEHGAMILRVSPSHVRFGSFELFYYRNEHQHLKPLADHVIHEHFNELNKSPSKYQDWLLAIIRKTATLMALWQSIGFAHGVMNTDNMSVLGLTLDYGPFGFLDHYDPDFICNHSDYHGRYAFKDQPDIGLWNLSCFAQSILPLLHTDPQTCADIANDCLKIYPEYYKETYLQLMRDKLGLSQKKEGDALLIDSLLALLKENKVDYTVFFRSLHEFKSDAKDKNNTIRALFFDNEAFDLWADTYKQRLKDEQSDDVKRRIQLSRINPVYIFRNYMAEIAIQKAEQGDLSEVNTLLELLKNPFEIKAGYEDYAKEPPDWAKSISVSCSS